MASDEHGMPVPHEDSPLPWEERLGGIEAANESWVLEDGFLDDRDLHFAIHAANNIIECREIVRRLAEPQALSLNDMELVIQAAAKLWDDMQRDVKGGDGG